VEWGIYKEALQILMKICLVLFGFLPPLVGGTSTQVRDLACYLSTHGHDVHVLTAGSTDEENSDGLYKITICKVPINNTIRRIPAFQIRVWQWLRHNDKEFDVIHFEECAGFIYLLFNLFSRMRRNNTIEHFHHDLLEEFSLHLKYFFKAPRENWPYLSMPFKILQEYISLRCAKKVITVSNNSCSVLRHWGINSRKIIVIPNAVSESFVKSEKQINLHTKNINFLFVGRLIPRKGIGVLIEALGILNKQGIDNFSIEIVGQGPLFKYCQRSISGFKTCHLLGLIPQQRLEKLYREADCFVCTSYQEGFGIVLLEAAASGPAIVANNIPVFREIYSENEVVYYKTNDPQDLADKMLMFITNPNLISSYSSNARAKVDYYRWENIGKAYIKVYSEITMSRKST